MNWNDFSSARVRIEYANMAKMNKIRAWARRNHSRVDSSRYARDAYEGYVHIPMRQGLNEQAELVKEIKAIIN